MFKYSFTCIVIIEQSMSIYHHQNKKAKQSHSADDSSVIPFQSKDSRGQPVIKMKKQRACVTCRRAKVSISSHTNPSNPKSAQVRDTGSGSTMQEMLDGGRRVQVQDKSTRKATAVA